MSWTPCMRMSIDAIWICKLILWIIVIRMLFYSFFFLSLEDHSVYLANLQTNHSILEVFRFWSIQFYQTIARNYTEKKYIKKGELRRNRADRKKFSEARIISLISALIGLTIYVQSWKKRAINFGKFLKNPLKNWWKRSLNDKGDELKG